MLAAIGRRAGGEPGGGLDISVADRPGAAHLRAVSRALYFDGAGRVMVVNSAIPGSEGPPVTECLPEPGAGDQPHLDGVATFTMVTSAACGGRTAVVAPILARLRSRGG